MKIVIALLFLSMIVELFTAQSCVILLAAVIAALLSYGYVLALPHLVQFGFGPIFGLILIAVIIAGQIAHVRARRASNGPTNSDKPSALTP